MKHHLNTLFVTTQGAYLAKEGEAVQVRVEGETRMRVPIHNLAGIVCFGTVAASPYLLGLCGERGVAVSFLTEHGRFLARVQGETSGNVLLRRAHYRQADDPAASAGIARAVVTAKVANCRRVLVRAASRVPAASREAVEGATARLAAHLAELGREGAPLDTVRGLEGVAARDYFEAFDHLVLHQKEAFFFRQRSRRPPLDNLNALLSFLYALLRHDVAAALEATGLDPAVGFLHRDRPGRPGLALDLMEELRPFLADRLALALVNRRQVRAEGFERGESGAVLMDEATRKTVLAAWQQRKAEELTHPFLGEKITVGLIPHLQARLLARHLRGDLDGYPPFFAR